MAIFGLFSSGKALEKKIRGTKKEVGELTKDLKEPFNHIPVFFQLDIKNYVTNTLKDFSKFKKKDFWGTNKPNTLLQQYKKQHELYKKVYDCYKLILSCNNTIKELNLDLFNIPAEQISNLSLIEQFYTHEKKSKKFLEKLQTINITNTKKNEFKYLIKEYNGIFNNINNSFKRLSAYNKHCKKYNKYYSRMNDFPNSRNSFFKKELKKIYKELNKLHDELKYGHPNNKNVEISFDSIDMHYKNIKIDDFESIYQKNKNKMNEFLKEYDNIISIDDKIEFDKLLKDYSEAFKQSSTIMEVIFAKFQTKKNQILLKNGIKNYLSSLYQNAETSPFYTNSEKNTREIQIIKSSTKNIREQITECAFLNQKINKEYTKNIKNSMQANMAYLSMGPIQNIPKDNDLKQIFDELKKAYKLYMEKSLSKKEWDLFLIDIYEKRFMPALQKFKSNKLEEINIDTISDKGLTGGLKEILKNNFSYFLFNDYLELLKKHAAIYGIQTKIKELFKTINSYKKSFNSNSYLHIEKIDLKSLFENIKEIESENKVNLKYSTLLDVINNNTEKIFNNLISESIYKNIEQPKIKNKITGAFKSFKNLFTDNSNTENTEDIDDIDDIQINKNFSQIPQLKSVYNDITFDNIISDIENYTQSIEVLNNNTEDYSKNDNTFSIEDENSLDNIGVFDEEDDDYDDDLTFDLEDDNKEIIDIK